MKHSNRVPKRGGNKATIFRRVEQTNSTSKTDGIGCQIAVKIVSFGDNVGALNIHQSRSKTLQRMMKTGKKASGEKWTKLIEKSQKVKHGALDSRAASIRSYLPPREPIVNNHLSGAVYDTRKKANLPKLLVEADRHATPKHLDFVSEKGVIDYGFCTSPVQTKYDRRLVYNEEKGASDVQRLDSLLNRSVCIPKNNNSNNDDGDDDSIMSDMSSSKSTNNTSERNCLCLHDGFRCQHPMKVHNYILDDDDTGLSV